MPTRNPNAGAGYEGRSFGNVLRDCLACGVLAVDADGKIAAVTPQAEQLLGFSAAQKQNPSRTLPPPVQALIREARATGQTVADRQIILHSNSAAATALLATAIPVPPGKPTGSVVLLLQDLSATEKLEHAMHRLERLASIGTLSASMAHEMKNALVPVRTFVGLLLEKNPDAELAGTVHREMGRVDTIVSRMLKFAAPVKRAVSLVRLHELLDHSLRLVQHRVEGKSISFNRHFNAAPDSFSGDDHQLEQAFVNLLLNAVEATGPEGAITVSTEAVTGDAQVQLREGGGTAGFLRVKITDTGAGIAAENLESIFEPFFTTKPSGTGLGLPVTRSIIEEHQGDIRVESQPGKGTTFTVLLPYSEAGSRQPPV